MNDTHPDLQVADDPMHQSTLDIVAIIDNHRHHEPHEVMSGLMRFERALGAAVDSIKKDLSEGPSPASIFEAMNAPLDLAMRFGASDLITIAQRAHLNFAPLLDGRDPVLRGAAAADAIVFLTVAEQTRIAVKILFHASMLHGRAPNGKRLELR